MLPPKNPTPFSFHVSEANQDQETVAIAYGGNRTGEATIQYGDSTASIDASVDVLPMRIRPEELDDFHHEFSTELLAFVSNRGAMAQDSEGQVIYRLGPQTRSFTLPSNHEVGLGYPNSW